MKTKKREQQTPKEPIKDKKADVKDSILRQEDSAAENNSSQEKELKQEEKNSKLQLNFNKNASPAQTLKEKMKKKMESLPARNKELSSLNEKLKQALNDNLYLRAEFENFKKRSAEETSQLIRYGGERFISSLANEVLDDLDRAMQSAQKEESFNNLKKGLEMIQQKLSKLLENFGVEILDPSGKAFDPSYQEALSYTKTSKVPDGHVAETFKKAYKLHDKVIRPAQVVLAKKENS